MKHVAPIGEAVQKELANWRLWWSRSVVVVAAALAGLTVVGFTRLCDIALDHFDQARTAYGWLPIALTPLVTALIVWITRKYFPGAAGSGIPQVMAALDTGVAPRDRGLFVSLRLTFSKIFLAAGGLLGGLSLGREGPSVQIAAGVMLHARRWMPARTTVTAHSLLVAGGAAGIAAAFNTPLGGVMFAIEELSRSPERRSSGLIIAGIVLAGMIAVSANDDHAYFGVIHAPPASLALLGPGLAVAVAAGLAGGVFSRLLIVSFGGQGEDVASRLRRRRPVLFAALCGLAIAVIGLVTDGLTFGSGYAASRTMVEGSGTVPASFSFFKFLATWLTAWSGVPAGIFAPSLAIGAAIGNDIALLAYHAQAPGLIALGMAGFLAAATQAPLTAFIIVMEMVDGHSMVLSLMACALVASGVARLVSQPLYPALARLQLTRVPARPEEQADRQQ